MCRVPTDTATPTVYTKLDLDSDLAPTSNPNGKKATLPEAVALQNGRAQPCSRDPSSKETSLGHDDTVLDSPSKETYYLPTDVAEQTRLDLQHEMCKLLLDGKLGLAPVSSPKHVLDVATGTGIWAIEYALVIGTDLSAMQPGAPATPNVSFVQQDVERDEWNFAHAFDYIHLRYIVTCFDDARRVFAKAHAALRPGGYIEIFDLVFEPRYGGARRGAALDTWCAAVYDAARKHGRDFRKAERYKAWLEAIGFVDVVDVELQCCGNAWSDDEPMRTIGAYHARAKASPLVSLGAYFGALDGPSDMLGHRAADLMLRDLEDVSIRLWWPIHVVYGRKAVQDESA